MSRYALFAGRDYDSAPGGGYDFRQLEGSVDSARAALRVLDEDVNWAHLLDLETGEIVAEWHELTGVEPREWIDGTIGYVYEKPAPLPPAPELSDGVKDREWVKAWYAAKGPWHTAPSASSYDECSVISERVFYLLVRPREIDGGVDWDTADAGFGWFVGEWDDYEDCPHWSWPVRGIESTEDVAWASCRAAVRTRAAWWSEITAEWQGDEDRRKSEAAT